jgi:hypothetical protein
MEQLKKHLSSTFFGVILVCFFTPFMEISCNEIKVANPSGWHFITGDVNKAYNKKNPIVKRMFDESLENKDPFSNSTKVKQPNIFLIVTLMSVIVGLLEIGFKWSRISVSIVSIIGLIGHLGFYFFAKSRIHEKMDELANTENRQMFTNFINFDFTVSFWLVAILFIAIAALNIYLITNKEEHNSKRCPFCAEDIKKEAIICRHCGQKLSDEMSNNDANTPIVDSGESKITLLFQTYILPVLLIVAFSSALYLFIKL